MNKFLAIVVVGVYVAYVATAAVVLVKDAKRQREEQRKLAEGIQETIDRLKSQIIAKQSEISQKTGTA